MSERFSNEPEAGLVQRIAEGDREAMAELVRLYQHRLYRFVRGILDRPEDGEECVMDTLLAVWQGAKGFQGRSRVSTWIFGIAHHKAVGRLPKAKRDGFAGLDEASSLPSSDPDPEAVWMRCEDTNQVRQALALLSPEHREVVELVFDQDKAYGEVAEIVGCPVNTVKTRMYYARQRLKQILAGMRMKRP